MTLWMTLVIALLLLILVFIVIGTLHSSISPMPSSKKAYQAMETMADQTGNTPLVDLGSGWGNLALRLAKRYPDRQVYGYEVSWIPFLFSMMMKKLLKLDNLTLARQDFFTAAWPDKATLLCYLFPGAMQRVADVLKQDKTSVDYVICNNFALPGHQPEQSTQIQDFYRSPIYFYRLSSVTSS